MQEKIQKEKIQKAKLTEERKGGPMVVKGLVFAIMVLTHRTKRACQSKEWSG